MAILSGAITCASLAMTGCEVDSFFDPSKTGRFMHTPTTIPIIDRIDVIEEPDDIWGETTGVLPEDLKPSDLTYRLSPGDFVTVEIFEAFTPGQWRAYPRRIDATGTLRVPGVGDVPAAGRTAQELEDVLVERLRHLVVEPHVNVLIEEGTAFTYTISGFLSTPGMFTLRRADLRLSEALAAVGGVPQSARKIFVVRQVPLTDEVKRFYERPPDDTPTPRQPRPRDEELIDIEDLIERLEDDPDAQPGMISNGSRPMRLASIDDLEPVRVADRPRVDIDEIDQDRLQPREPTAETFIYVEERGEWVRTRAPLARPERPNDDVDDTPTLIMQRVIEIPYERLRVGDSSYDIVIRPNDRVIVEGPPQGVVYVSGEVNRPGVYNMPVDGTRLTLSRLVAAAGDLGPVAVPERVDLTRRVGPSREATIRLDLAAIRRRTEPDLFIRPDDHIIIGTSWVATPLAVIRNGFRTTYGFGFLLDRNFGNDVFGPPPFSRERF